MYMNEEELKPQGAFKLFEKGIHDIHEGDPWENGSWNVKKQLPELLTNYNALKDTNREHVVPDQKRLSSRLFLCKYKRIVRNPGVPTLFKGLMFEAANQMVRAVVNSVPLTACIRQTAMTNPVVVAFYARWLGATQPALRNALVPNQRNRMV